VLDFDLATTNLQSIKSRKLQTIGWSMLDYIADQGNSGQIPLNACITARGSRTAPSAA